MRSGGLGTAFDFLVAHEASLEQPLTITYLPPTGHISIGLFKASAGVIGADAPLGQTRTFSAYLEDGVLDLR